MYDWHTTYGIYQRKGEHLMINILLVCSAGMSTSMMVKKMQEEALKKEIEANIWAVGDTEASRYIDRMDVMLLGPQIRFQEKKMKEIAKGKPVAVIDMNAYGTMNGERVLKQALKLLES